MKARALIRAADLDPRMRKVVLTAFEHAWEEVAYQASSDPEIVEAARMTLAEIVLQLVRNGTRDAQALTKGAVRGMLDMPKKL